MSTDPDETHGKAQGGPIAARLTRVPRAMEQDRGAEVAALFPDHPPEIRALLKGAAGASPYLLSLVEREQDWLNGALAEAPEAAFDSLLEIDTSDLARNLRVAKRRAALLIALGDLGGVWGLAQVTSALTRFADRAVALAITDQVGREIARGKVPGASPEDAAHGAGMVAIAMGKMGAHELNFSSDIDLICLFDETRFDEDDVLEARASFIRATRGMAKMLSDNTPDGYVLRTDLRLRPDAAVTPVCVAMAVAERYYESVGRTWERAAHIKARAAAGDVAAGAAYLKRLTPFVFRRHLDFAAIQDAHDMRLRIRSHKALHGGRVLEGHDMKLGSGGIREIEFYTQTRQIISGGRDPELRLRGTVEALAALEAKGWTDAAEPLTAAYSFHREVEHRLQMIADQQTHSLPTTRDGFARLAALMDRDVDDLRREITRKLDEVAGITEAFFDPGPSPPAVIPDDDPTLEIVERWKTYPAFRSPRASEIFTRMQPELFRRLEERAASKDEALAHLDGFLAGLPAGVQLFSMFEANPQLIDLIVDIAATSPALAEYLSRHSQVLDAVLGGGFFADWTGMAALRDDLAYNLDRADDYETKLLVARTWRNEWHFRIGVHHLRGLIDGGLASEHYADLADAVLAALYPEVCDHFAVKHGPPPGRGAALLAMGSLGARALTATSDIDLIMIYDADGVETSNGPRPLATRTYYARLTQAFLTALTAPMGPGRLYEVDMRLRPSGRQGPVATTLSSYMTYQREEAWTWEHLALTRARAVAGVPRLCREVEAFRSELLAAPRARAAVLGDVAEMRRRLAEARPTSAWNVKDGPGRLQDIELLAEAAALLAGVPARDVNAQLEDGALGFAPDEVRCLSETYKLFRRVQNAARLMTGGTLDPNKVGQGGRAFLLRETGFDDIGDLEEALVAHAARAADLIDGEFKG